MATIQFSNGQSVEFNGTPTQQDVEEIAAKLGLHQSSPAQQPITPPPTQPPQGFFGKALNAVANFTGVQKLGEGAGDALAAPGIQADQKQHLNDAIDQQSKILKLIKDKEAIGADTTALHKALAYSDQTLHQIAGDNKAFTNSLPTNNEVLGSAAQTALNIGLAGSASGLSKGTGALVKEAAPAVLKTGAKAVATRIGAKAATGFVAGGALGTAQGITDNKTIGQSLKEGLVSGTIGSVLGGGAAAGSELIRGLTAPQLTEKLYNSAIGVSSKTAMSGKSPSAALIKDGVVGTAQHIYDRAQSTIDKVDPQINSLLQKSDKSVKLESVLATLAHGVNTSVGNEGEGAFTANEMKDVIQSSLPQVRTLLDKDTLTLAEANKLRQIMDKTLGDRAFTGATLPFKKDALYDASNALRGLVQNLEPATKPLFKDYSTSVQTIKALNSELSKPHVLRHMLSLLSATGGGLPGLAAGLVNEGAQTTIAKTGAAVGLNAIGAAQKKLDANLAAQLVKRFGRLGALNAAKELTATASQ